MNDQQLRSKDSKREKKTNITYKVQYVKTCDILRTAYNLLLNATVISQYNTASIKMTEQITISETNTLSILHRNS